MQHDSIFRCIDPACGRTLPRSVNFCPYCGTAQGGESGHGGTPSGRGAAVPAAAAAAATAGAAQAAAAPAPPAPAPAPPPAPPVPTPAPPQAVPPAAGGAAGIRPGPDPVAGPAPAPGGRPLPPPPQLPPLPPLPPSPGTRAQGGAAAPKRAPVRLRWWILALAALWGIWLLANPSARRIEAQMDKAITLAKECRPRDAQTELIALRKTKATPEQLQQVQRALNDAAGMCTRKRQRDKAWREAKTAVEAAIASSSAERARQRLRTFTRRWGEDQDTRALKDEIDERWPEHPRADEVERGGRR